MSLKTVLRTESLLQPSLVVYARDGICITRRKQKQTHEFIHTCLAVIMYSIRYWHNKAAYEEWLQDALFDAVYFPNDLEVLCT